MKLKLYSLLLLFAALVSVSSAQTYVSVTVDGDASEWAGVPLYESDPTTDSTSTADISAVYLANDDNYLYALVEMTTDTVALGADGGFYTFIDGNGNASEGFGPNGGSEFSEFASQESFFFFQSSGVFNTGGSPTGVDFLIAPAAATPAQFYEMRFSRASDGFTGSPATTAFMVSPRDGAFAATDLAPNDAPTTYTFAISSSVSDWRMID
ncbi:MAG: hypothetical protein RLY93_12860 [Sumerlaeia bacterium]